MTGRVVRHAQRHAAARHRACGSEQLADVTNAGAYSSSTFRILAVVAQEVAVILHHRAAPGRVYRYEVGTRFFKRLDVAPSQRFRTWLRASMRVEGAATLLAAGRHRPVSVPRQHPFRRAIRVVEEPFHHAAVEYCN